MLIYNTYRLYNEISQNNEVVQTRTYLYQDMKVTCTCIYNQDTTQDSKKSLVADIDVLGVMLYLLLVKHVIYQTQ